MSSGRDPTGALPRTRARARLAALAPTVVGVGLAAVAVAYDPLATAAAPKRAALLAAAVVALAVAIPPRLARGRHPLPPRAVVLWLALVAWLGVGTAWAPHGRLGHLPAFLGFGALSLALSGMRGLREVARVVATLVATTCGAVALAAWASGARGVAVHGLCGNPNWLGLVLACCLPLELDLAHSIWRSRRAASAPAARRGDRRAVELALVALAIGLGLAGLVLARSRTSWVALLVAALALLRGPTRLFALGPAAMLCAAALGDDDLAPAVAGRVWIWRHAAHAALAAQPLGAGAGEFPWAFLDAQARTLAPLPLEGASRSFTNATSAHDDWLELACEGGVLALALAVLAFASGVTAARRTWRAGAGCLLVAATAAVADTPLTQPGVLVVLAPVFAATTREARADVSPRDPLRRVARLATALAGIVALAAAAWCLRLATASYLGERLVTAARDAPPPERTALLARARALVPSSGEALLESGLDALAAGAPLRAAPWLEAATRRLADVGALVALGNARLLLGEVPQARSAYERALAIQPASFRAHVNLAEALRLDGELDAAERHLAAARELQPFHPKVLALAERLWRTRANADAGPSPPP